MLNSRQALAQAIFTDKLEQIPTRDGYGKGVVQAGEENEQVVVLCADLTESTRSHWFEEKFPERFIQVGVAEQNLASVAAGMSLVGKIPFISSYAMFSPGRNWEQIRTTICYNEANVKIVGAHAGVSVGPDGATHQAIEDIAIMRPIANMKVVVPCDAIEAQKATFSSAFARGPMYIRIGREKTPVFTTKETPFEIGKAEIFWHPPAGGPNPLVAIIACGSVLYNALIAAKELEKEGIGTLVVNNHTIKPMDENTIIEAAKQTAAVVTVEEHQVQGGMGSAVAELLAKANPVPIEFLGVQNEFGQSGKPEELIEHYGMGARSIKDAVKRVLQRKI
jgi:transketolase